MLLVLAKTDLRPGNILRLQYAGEMSLATVVAAGPDAVKTITAFAPDRYCITILKWHGEKLASERGVEFGVSRVPRMPVLMGGDGRRLMG